MIFTSALDGQCVDAVLVASLRLRTGPRAPCGRRCGADAALRGERAAEHGPAFFQPDNARAGPRASAIVVRSLLVELAVGPRCAA